MVDPHAVVLLPGTGLIIPVAVKNLCRMAGAQSVCKAVMAQAVEGSAAFRPGKSVALPSRRVVAVDILRDHIEISAQNNWHFRCQHLAGTGA